MDIIKGHNTIVDAAREYDFKQSEIQKCIDTFMEYGRQGLKSHPNRMGAAYEEQLKYQLEKIGEPLLQIDKIRHSAE